jgi:hypothetical protein
MAPGHGSSTGFTCAIQILFEPNVTGIRTTTGHFTISTAVWLLPQLSDEPSAFFGLR